MGKRVNMHAIGDAAAHLGLNGDAAARKANKSWGRTNFTLAHLQLVAPSDYDRFGKLGVFADMQLQWAVSDFWTEDALHPFIGNERYSRMYPAKSLIKAGAPFSQGSDWPVDPLNPWNEIMTAHTRFSAYTEGNNFLGKDEAIPVAKSLRAHTMGSARQLGLGAKVGSLERGKSADIIVINQNPLKVDPKKIADTRVLRTIVGGKTVYRPSKTSAKLLAKAASLSTGEMGHDH